ncbi:recombinase family protein [Bacillus solimangrovi]|uniref:DNA recombinase n=1 Tax=Bacillus solimangrovi TaxID=1305675 RepID=A0A1E5LER9_9BACI|nr:recombinase family protein [Bacillus solimangrovi]OEH92570.1 hypothetical protein BFG57_15270 [Bacillus solimangrovi]
MKTVAYYRSSTSIQENSIEMQRQMATNCSINHVLPIEREYVDEAVSGRKTMKEQRQGLSELLQDINNGQVQNLFVYKRDRLARKAVDYIEVYHLLREKDVNVIFTAENEVPIQFSAVGELLELLMAGIIQREGEQIVERIQETIKANFQRGINPGNLPFGYSYDKSTKTIELNESELEVVKFIFDELVTGDYQSLRELKQVMDKRQYTRNDKSWTVSLIKKTVMNATYMGLRTLTITNQTLERKYEHLAVVDEAQWMEANALLDKLSSSKTKRITNDVPYLLEGLVICKKCDSPLIGKAYRRKEQVTYKYVCKNHAKVAIEKTMVEQKLLQHCIDFINALVKSNFQELFHRYNQQYEDEANVQVELFDNKITQLNKKLVVKTEKWFYEKRTDEKEKLENQLIKMYDQLSVEKKERDDHLQDLCESKELTEKVKMQDLPAFSETIQIPMSSEQQKELFKDIIETVLISPQSYKVVFKHPFLEVKGATPHASI